MGKKVKAKVTVNTKKKPVKAGSTNRGGDGGIFSAKVIKITTKLKNGKNG